jgi:hypothetical protein
MMGGSPSPASGNEAEERFHPDFDLVDGFVYRASFEVNKTVLPLAFDDRRK